MAKRKRRQSEEEILPTEQPTSEEATPSVGEASPVEPQGGAPEPQSAEPTPESGESAPGASDEAEDLAARLSSLEQELEAVRAQAQEYLDGWTRERAAFANYKRRVEEERQRQQQQLLAEVVKEFLVVLDDLELALKNRPQEGEGAAWAEGIALIYNKLCARLEAKGVEQIAVEPGQPFDPQFHEAISHEPVDGHESGHIIEVVRPGYRVGDLVIRPALVRVAQ
ncbi:MAG TPA: nucleotide exchange factor GrpE [Anaerolineae bacterium]|nr:nucleotide exchange factor GrpE [Anaerolineae bacterium]HID85497.1 nucleotide exchange factor GrpE [Anaerolineales bacterium]HIQ07983.1 nucleotide exchange factor GrpE [Anaerolineaceae bacterium]